MPKKGRLSREEPLRPTASRGRSDAAEQEAVNSVERGRSDPSLLNAGEILQLQRTAGNNAVLQLLAEANDVVVQRGRGKGKKHKEHVYVVTIGGSTKYWRWCTTHGQQAAAINDALAAFMRANPTARADVSRKGRNNGNNIPADAIAI